uniref:Uncharacterized protein n=1 Tax=Arundo donax TaxID=35708 RepID=A0A0A9HSZ7_ARUDO
MQYVLGLICTCLVILPQQTLYTKCIISMNC